MRDEVVDDNARRVVLVVDDEPLLLMLAVAIVEEAGYDAVTATDADMAIEILLSRTDIRIVFTDIDMPGSMDGLKLAAAVRDRWPPIEIIVTSGKMRPEQDALPTRGLFIPKPYTASRIINVLQKMAA